MQVLLSKERSCRGVNHGTFLHIAHEEGLIKNSSIHAGIRAPVMRPKGDLRNDVRCGFHIIRARDINRIGTDGIIKALKERVSDSRVYISVDIDVLDPAFAPGKCSAFKTNLSFRGVCFRRFRDDIRVCSFRHGAKSIGARFTNSSFRTKFH